MIFIYCRGGDKQAPLIAQQSGMLYGIRYDYKAYAPVYMLDCGLKPRWAQYKRVVARLRPTFALVPDFETYRDIVQINLYIDDLRDCGVPLIGVTPKFYGALDTYKMIAPYGLHINAFQLCAEAEEILYDLPVPYIVKEEPND